MRAVIQRVTSATVTINNQVRSSIKKGLLIFLGISNDDGISDIKWISKKIINLRIFNDEQNIMNRSIVDINGEIIVVSQFTLMASTKKGNRPSYIKAAKPEIAIPIYEQFISQIENDLNKPVGTGIFGADMKIELLNDGPVTIIIDSKKKE
ncbi:MAG: D-aminoacyl-tRNA deacylase [Aureibaculum sp.]|nr:D-aminoacyl-tRNA deacylase [Aureibaculum sp.]